MNELIHTKLYKKKKNEEEKNVNLVRQKNSNAERQRGKKVKEGKKKEEEQKNDGGKTENKHEMLRKTKWVVYNREMNQTQLLAVNAFRRYVC